VLKDLFLLLHRNAHLRVVRGVAEREAHTCSAPHPFVPPYFAALLEATRGRIPAEPRPPLRPGVDDAEIAAQLASMGGAAAALPAYEALPGTRWSVLSVSCPRCKGERLVVHAHFIDLVAAPQMASLIVEGRINRHRCPRCATAVFLPRLVWVGEPPLATDVLNAAAAVVRSDDTTRFYCTPPGTVRERANDRVLEQRAEQLFEEYGISTAHAHRIIVYGDDELATRIQQATADDEMPFAMRSLIWIVAEQLDSGQLPLADAEPLVRASLPADAAEWRVMLEPSALDDGPHANLARALVAEATARMNGSPQVVQGFLAQDTIAAYLWMREVGLAEAVLARARDLFEQVPEGPDREMLRDALDEAQAAIFVKLGNHDAAAEIRASVLSRRPAETALPLRATRHQHGASLALSLFRTGRLREAFEMFRREIAAMEALLPELDASAHEMVPLMAPALRKTISGSLANWSTLVFDVADMIEALEHGFAARGSASRPQAVPTALSPEIRARVEALARRQQLDTPERIAALQEAIPLVEEHVRATGAPEDTPLSDAARAVARGMLERALAISESIGGWGFASVQASRLAKLRETESDDEAAAALMRKALDYAGRVDDHVQLIEAHMFFADRAGKRGDGAEALVHARHAAREEIRKSVGLGHHAQPDGSAAIIGFVALQCARFGALALEAVVVAESLKAISTTVNLTHGVAFRVEGDGGGATARIRQLTDERERLRLRAIQGLDASGRVRAQIEALDVSIEQARREASLRDPRYARWCDATSLDVSDPGLFVQRLRSLGPRATYIGFFRLGDTVRSYAAWDGGAVVSSNQWIEADPEDTGTGPHPPLRTEASLRGWADFLLGPLEERLCQLEPDDPLIISLHDDLAHVPFAALPLRGKRLCERARISHVQGIGVFSACIARESAFDEVLAIGNPDRPDFDPLPAAAAEAEDIAALFRAAGRRAAVLLGREATLGALRGGAARADVLHFACHAPVDAPPRLLLAMEPEKTDTGELTDTRILDDLHLKPGCLVNLAACESARQADSIGPVVRGLVPAFLVGGASAVLATMWRIADEPAARFSAAFYRRLLAGAGPAASLAETQRDCLAGRLGDDMRALRHWAGYQLFGAGR